jgi:hypothetical protein
MPQPGTAPHAAHHAQERAALPCQLADHLGFARATVSHHEQHEQAASSIDHTAMHWLLDVIQEDLEIKVRGARSMQQQQGQRCTARSRARLIASTCNMGSAGPGTAMGEEAHTETRVMTA